MTDPGIARSPRPRWDGDVRGVGVADAGAWRSLVASLADITAEDGWVAEEPEAHLLPHLVAAAESGPLRIRRAETDADGTFVVELRWVVAGEPTRRAIRSALFALLATIAETLTLVHEPPARQGLELEVLTGALDGDGPFAGHGHTIRLTVARPDQAMTADSE
jgi:hypothetical protein